MRTRNKKSNLHSANGCFVFPPTTGQVGLWPPLTRWLKVQADFSQRRLRFRLGPEEAEVSLPGRRDTARSSGAAGPSRLREAAFHFFVALREALVWRGDS